MKKYSKLIAFSLLVIMLLCAASCGRSVKDGEPSNVPETDESSALPDPIPMFDNIEYTTYIYEKDGTGGAFTISLGSNGSFDYYEGSLSSYIGHGDWKLEDGIITLTDKTYFGDIQLTNKFRYENGSLTYIAEGSDGFIYVKVSDGDKFPVYDEERDKDKFVIISRMAQTRVFNNNATGYMLFLQENGEFDCTKNNLDRFLLKGEWSMDGNIVTLTRKDEDGKELAARFSYDGKSLTYIAEGSDSDMLSGTSDGVFCVIIPYDILIEVRHSGCSAVWVGICRFKTMQIATDNGLAAEAELFCKSLRLVLRGIRVILSRSREGLSLVLHIYYINIRALLFMRRLFFAALSYIL